MKARATLSALVLALLAGCTPQQQAEVRERVRGIQEETRQAAADAALATKVRTVLATRKGLDASRLQVEARGGHVILKGEVASREQAELAERAAMEVEGVQSVENQLTVRVPAKSLPPPGAL